jgi:phosphoglycolate phosphatase-like HAD superfamily hydrolase
VFLLDLDGVLVDSAGELAGSAYDCALSRWPAAMASSPYSREEVLAGLAGGRPRVIAGYEALAQARLMAELGPADGVAAVLADWPGDTLAAALARWGESAATLAPAFEAHRAAAAADEATWLAANRAYPGVVAALRDVCGPWYVVSSKSAARVAVLLRGLLGQAGAGFEVGGPRLWAGLQPPDTAKPAPIADLAARVWGGLEGRAEATIHFVDDRYETLAAVASAPDLGPAVSAGRLRLHHAAWGYAAPAEAAAAAADPAVSCLDLPAFIELLRWGRKMEK